MKRQKTSNHRPERIASVLKRSIAVIVEELSDPHIHDVSVVDVEVTNDLHYATVWVDIDGNDAEVLAALEKSAGYVRRTLTEEISEMRVIPQIRFAMDKSRSYYEHIDEVIKGLHHDKDGE